MYPQAKGEKVLVAGGGAKDPFMDGEVREACVVTGLAEMGSERMRPG